MQSSWFVWWWRKGGSRISIERKMEAITKEWKGTFLLGTILGLGPHPSVTMFLTALRELLNTLVTRALMPTTLPALTPCQTLTLISKPLRLEPYLITSCLPSLAWGPGLQWAPRNDSDWMYQREGVPTSFQGFSLLEGFIHSLSKHTSSKWELLALYKVLMYFRLKTIPYFPMSRWQTLMTHSNMYQLLAFFQCIFVFSQ